MSCTDNTCGTGGGNLPKPGDPSNDITISAVPAYGGIDVLWTLPLTNPFAVSYAVIYRSPNNQFGSAIPIGRDTDGFYHDKVPPNVDYFYWVQLVSINGTHSEIVGPATARAMSSIEQTIIDLTGKIDEGYLAQVLKEKIASITANNAAIYQEVQDRLAANVALQNALAAVQSESGQAMTYVLQEINARESADGAIVESVEAIAAGLGDAQAAIAEIQTVQVGQDEATASKLQAMTARIADAEGAIVEEASVRATNDQVLVDSYNALYGRVGTAEGAITSEANLRIAADEALGTRIDNVSVSLGEDIAAAVQVETNARVTADEALASQITQAESRLGDDIVQVQTGLSTEIDSITGALNGMYYAKVGVNGLIGGFGIWNNGQQVQAGFDVDEFWVGRTSTDKKKPFIISDGQTYIDDAVIYKVTFSKLRADDGSVIIENGKLKADYIDVENLTARKIEINKVGSPAGISMDNQRILVRRSTNGSTSIRMGQLL